MMFPAPHRQWLHHYLISLKSVQYEKSKVQTIKQTSKKKNNPNKQRSLSIKPAKPVSPTMPILPLMESRSPASDYV